MALHGDPRSCTRMSSPVGIYMRFALSSTPIGSAWLRSTTSDHTTGVSAREARIMPSSRAQSPLRGRQSPRRRRHNREVGIAVDRCGSIADLNAVVSCTDEVIGACQLVVVVHARADVLQPDLCMIMRVFVYPSSRAGATRSPCAASGAAKSRGCSVVWPHDFGGRDIVRIAPQILLIDATPSSKADVDVSAPGFCCWLGALST
jgi:hypothetical protein